MLGNVLPNQSNLFATIGENIHKEIRCQNTNSITFCKAIMSPSLEKKSLLLSNLAVILTEKISTMQYVIFYIKECIKYVLKTLLLENAYAISIFVFFSVSIFFFVKKKEIPDSIFISWLILFFFISDIPYFFQNYSIGIDEGLMLAQSISLQHGMIFWSEVDFTTSGPYNSLILIPINMLLGKADYTTCRIAFFIFNSISIVFTYLTASKIYTQSISRVLIFGIVLFFLGTTHCDFRHYSSELLCISLLSISFYLMLKILIKESTYINSHFFIIGLILGILPFAKLQVIPLAFVVFICCLFLLYAQYKEGNLKPMVWFVIGGIISPLAMSIYIVHFDILAIFNYLYLELNLKYGSKGAFLMPMLSFIDWFQLDSIRIHLYISLFCIILFVVTDKLKKETAENKNRTYFDYFILVYLIAVIFVITKSGYLFSHYFYLYYSCLLNGMLLSRIVNADLFKRQVNGLILIIALLSVLYFNPTIVESKEIGNEKTIQLIKSLKSKDEKMVVWGWNFDYYIKTESPQGNMENHIARFFMWPESNNIMIPRYVQSLKEQKPVIIIEGITSYSFFTDRQRFGMQAYPTINEYVMKNYKVFQIIEENVIYLRNDRFIKLTNSKKL